MTSTCIDAESLAVRPARRRQLLSTGAFWILTSQWIGLLIVAVLISTTKGSAADIRRDRYWVSTTSKGGYMGVWVETSATYRTTVKFSSEQDGLAATVSYVDRKTGDEETTFSHSPRVPKRVKAGAVIGFSGVAGTGPLPGKTTGDRLTRQLPPGLLEDLRALGASPSELQKMKLFLSGSNAIERYLDPAGLSESGPGFASRDSRKSPPSALPSSPGAAYRGDGRAGSDSDAGPRKDAPLTRASDAGSLHRETNPDQIEMARQEAELNERERTEREGGTPGIDKTTGRSTSTGARNAGFTYYEERDDGREVVLTRVSVTSQGEVRTELHREPRATRSAVIEALRAGDEAKARRLHEEAARLVRESLRPSSRENPSENRRIGGLGVDPGAWGYLNGTGLASHLWSSWLAKTRTDVASPLRQPPLGDENRAHVRSTPRVTRDAVINPAEGGRSPRTPPTIPDLRDPFPDSNPGGGRPKP